jgi:hypothetical protein
MLEKEMSDGFSPLAFTALSPRLYSLTRNAHLILGVRLLALLAKVLIFFA